MGTNFLRFLTFIVLARLKYWLKKKIEYIGLEEKFSTPLMFFFPFL